MGRKIVSRTYGVVSALILSTSLEFLILSKFAILDIVVATCVWLSLCFGMLTTFCEEKNKKYLYEIDDVKYYLSFKDNGGYSVRIINDNKEDILNYEVM